MLKLDIQMFASTNKTTNYELPQFVGTDKPTWLSDFNGAMATIDAGMHENATDISDMASDVASASSAASQASSDVATLTSTVGTLSSNVSTATTTANNAQSTATSALNTANTANGKADTNASAITSLDSRVDSVEEDIAEFNFDTFTTISKSDTTASNVNSDYIVTGLTLATNSGNKNVFKLYGQVYGKLTTWNQTGYISFNSPLRPESDISINGAGIISFEVGGAPTALRLANFEVKTTGEIRIYLNVYSEQTSDRVMLNANLYFVKDFGDEPEA